MVGPYGLEPQTSTVSRGRSSQLSYAPSTKYMILIIILIEFREKRVQRRSTSFIVPTAYSGASPTPNLQSTARLIFHQRVSEPAEPHG